MMRAIILILMILIHAAGAASVNERQQIIRERLHAKRQKTYDQEMSTRRLKSDKSSKSTKAGRRSYHNIFVHDEGNMDSTTLSHMRLVDNTSEHKSEPPERNAPKSASEEEPCPEFENRDPFYNQYQNLYGNNKATETDSVTVTDSVLGDINESNVHGSEGTSRGTWKYATLGMGSILCVAILALFRKQSLKRQKGKFGSKGDQENSTMLTTIDCTVPLDETGGYSTSGTTSTFSRLNSNKAYSELEEVAAPRGEPSMDFGSIAPHDPTTASATASSLLSSNLDLSESLQSNEEAFGNIDEYEVEYYDDDIETENYYEEENEDDEYYYDYEIEDPDTEEIDDRDMEEGTLSWEEEEYLSTIDEESYAGSSGVVYVGDV